MAEQPVKLADLFSKCSEMTAQGERERDRIAGTMTPLLAWLNESVVLRPGALGGAFRGFKSVTLEAGSTVVMMGFDGKVSSKPLAQFGTEECLAIVHDAFPELQRMVASKKRAGEVRPALSLKVVLGGPRFIVGRRSYRLTVANKGGDCLGVRVSTRLPGGWSKPSRPCDVTRGRRAEVDLGLSREVGGGSESLELLVECKDVDGRELCGVESVRLDGDGWQELALGRTRPGLRSLLRLSRAAALPPS
jgi:hypothetical protein